ncbi:MAG: acyl-CoA dehydrogenase family protein [Streptosporangiaceae bacterium]|nr:acyl-CoA dehydrogenase family protein [Streptosporangiaceae bacterium]
MDDEEFRASVREWLTTELSGEFAGLAGKGGPGREHELVAERLAWERRLGEGGWIGLGWPVADGGRGLSWRQQVIFHEEYARAGAPGRAGHIGEQLLGPALLMFGTAEQKARFLPGILAGTSTWCQGYSEPEAGSDLAGLRTRAGLGPDGKWRVDGQKVWTSLAQFADWCFVLARTDSDRGEPSPRTPAVSGERHRGLSCLLVSMHQAGVTVRPIVQLTGTSEFNEVFFSGAVADDLIGAPGDGWRVAMGTLGVERGVSTFGQQLGFAREFEAVLGLARARGVAGDPDIAARIADAWIELQVLRFTAEASFGSGSEPGVEANIVKLLWAPWHQRLGELAADVAGPDATVTGASYELSDEQRLFLFTRADTIYGGSSEIQRNVIAERGLGLPRGLRRHAGAGRAAGGGAGFPYPCGRRGVLEAAHG